MIISLLFMPLIFSSCATKEDTSIDEQLAIHNILVLSTDISTDKGHSRDGKSKKNLEEGRRILDQQIKRYFINNNKITFISSEKQETLLKSYNQNRLQRAIHLGKQLSADAVLVCQIDRFQKRDGKEYSVIEPAALAFKYRLVETSSGQTLCVGSYDELQKPWTENILSFKKTMSRGGKWIKAENLAIEAINEKFDTCNYFKN